MKPNNSKSIPASFRQTIWRSWLSWLLLLAYVWLNLSTYNPIIGGALALLAILLAMNGLAQTQQWFLVDDQHWWKRHPILYHLHKIFDEGEFAGILFALIFGLEFSRNGDRRAGRSLFGAARDRQRKPYSSFFADG